MCEHEQVQTRYGTPATVAGESIATDTNKCALKPLRRTDYYPIGFTDAQWAQLVQVFPTGVCDWAKPGVADAGRDPVDELPGRRERAGDLRRPPARRGARRVGLGLDEPVVRLLAPVADTITTR